MRPSIGLPMNGKRTERSGRNGIRRTGATVAPVLFVLGLAGDTAESGRPAADVHEAGDLRRRQSRPPSHVASVAILGRNAVGESGLPEAAICRGSSFGRRLNYIVGIRREHCLRNRTSRCGRRGGEFRGDFTTSGLLKAGADRLNGGRNSAAGLDLACHPAPVAWFLPPP
jgi:hypothetical protein